MDTPVNSAADSGWLSVRQTADLLKVSRQYVYRLLTSGRLVGKIISTWPTPHGVSSIRLVSTESAVAYSRSRG